MTRASGSSNPPGSSPSRSSAQQLVTPVPSGFIGRYQILDRIGEGGMGSLFLARDPAIDRLVAIKLLRHGLDTEALRERFSREARAAGRLRHPHIVTIFDVGEHDGDPFIAMEFLAGETLAELIREGARLSLSRRLKLIEELCDGLAYAHRAGLVHRDVKPANLMVDAEGTLKILDFGIVRVNDSGMTQAGVLVGTVNYMSPEQVVGNTVDHRSDIFAVGLVAYELITGRSAFSGTIKDGLLHRILNVEIPPLASVAPGLDDEVAAIVSQALAKEPSDRYQDLARMRNDLGRARLRLERSEELAALEAAAAAGETALISQHETVADGGSVVPSRGSSSWPGLAADAERALADGNFRTALTLAGRSAAINPADRSISDVAARAEAALLDRGRQMESGTLVAPAKPVSSVPPPAPVTPASGSGTASAGGTRAMWVAVGIAMLSLVIAVVALWSRDRGERGVPSASGSVSSAPTTPVPAPVPPDPETKPNSSAAPDAGRGAADAANRPGGEGDRPDEPKAPPADEPPAAGEPTRGATSASPGASPRGNERTAAASRGNQRGGTARQEPPSRSLPPPSNPVSATPPAPAPAPAVPTGPLRAGIDVSAARRVRGSAPAYPRDAQSAGVQGTVLLDVTIGPDGRVTDARVVRGVRGLDDAALAAVREWQYEPPRYNGQPVSIVQSVSVPFELPDPPKPATRETSPPPASPPVKSPEPARPPAPAPDPRQEIEGTLRRYEAAWESGNVEALQQVQVLAASAVENIRRSMNDGKYEIAMTIQQLTVDPSGKTAVARVAVTRSYRPRVGRDQNERQTNDFSLERRADGWVIVRIR